MPRILLALLCLASSAYADRSLLVLSKGDHTLSMVDPKSLKVTAKMPVGDDPHEVIASTDGKTAYVSNTGMGRMHELDILDLVQKKALPAFDTGALLGPHGLTFAGGKVWMTVEGAKAVARFDPGSGSGKVDFILGTGQNRTHMLYVSPDERHIYATNVDSGTVSVIDLVLKAPPLPPTGKPMGEVRPRPEWVQTVVPGSDGNEGFDVTPDGKELWTAASRDGSIIVIDPTTKQVKQKVDAKVNGANRVKISTDGKLALVSSLQSGDVTVVDTATRKEVKRIHVGQGASGLLIDPESPRAFVSCTPDDYVAVIDLVKLVVTGKINAGTHPDGLAWAVWR